MTANEESTQTQADDLAQANPNPSPSEEVEPLSQPSSVSKEDFDKLVGVVTELTKRYKGIQSKTDKLENKLANQLKSLGIEITPEMQDKLVVMDLQEKVDYLSAQLEEKEPAIPVPQNTPDFAKIIKQAELDPSDPNLIQLTAQYANDPVGLGIALGRISAEPPPAAAGATSPAGQGNPKVDHDLAELQKDKDEYTDATNSGNLNKARELRKRFREKHGAAWDNIDWEYEDRLPL